MWYKSHLKNKKNNMHSKIVHIELIKLKIMEINHI